MNSQENFELFWKRLQANLKPGDTIRNWTAANGYLGDKFIIAAVSDSAVDVDTPNAETIQHVSKNDFEYMYSNWKAYKSGRMRRHELRDKTRFSKYTISILKELEK